MVDLQDFYDALIASPYNVFMVMPDGKILTWQEIHDVTKDVQDIFDFDEIDLLPTSCNPLHGGHRDIYDNFVFKTKRAYELSISRWGKERLSLEELERRVEQFENYAPVLITNSSRFAEKCAVLSFIHFVRFHVGTDTMERLRDDLGEVGIAGLKCSFEVYDRDMDDGKGMIVYPVGWKHPPQNAHRSPRNDPQFKRRQMSSTKIRAELAAKKENGPQ